MHWNLQYLKSPGDFLHIAFPMAACPGSRIARSWLDRIESAIFSTNKLVYCNFMTALSLEVRNAGLEQAIACQRRASPFNRLSAVYAGLTAKRHLFDKTALDGAMCVNNIWQSSMKTTTGTEAYEVCDRVADPDSIWMEVSTRWKRHANLVPTKRLRHKTAAIPQAGGVAPEMVEQDDANSSSSAANLVPTTRLRRKTEAIPQAGGVAPDVARAPTMADKCVGDVRTFADKCVGESVWGDPLGWRTIMDMP